MEGDALKMKRIKLCVLAWMALIVATGPVAPAHTSGAVIRDAYWNNSVGVVRSLAADIQPAVVYDDLTEIFARKSYDNQKPFDLLYAGQSMQPEVVHFRDVTYGAHIWRITHTAQGYTYAHNHINRSPWNADGSRLGLISNRRFPPYWYNPATGVGDPHLYLVDSDGDNLINLNSQNCPSCTADSTRFRHFVWDRFDPNYTYFAANDGLYRLDVTRPGVYDKVANLSNTARQKVIYATPSEENVVMVIDDLAGSYSDPLFYFVDLQKSLGDPAQVISYPIAFQLDWPGHDQTNETSFHDIYFTRRGDGSYGFNYGPIAGVGEPIFFIAPLDGNAANVSLWYDNQGSLDIPYHSHPVWGPGGALTAYFGEQYPYGSNRWGWQIADDAARTHIQMVGAYDGTILGGGHIAWDGYDPDWLFCVSGSDEDRRLFRAHIGGSENNAEPFVNPYSGLNDDQDGYQTLPRPAQSPDGTKIFYHSSMMASTDAFVDAYIAVARYPQPPLNVRMASSTEFRLAWDAPLFYREIKGYHVYRSEGAADHFVEVTGEAIAALEFTDGALVADRDYYYAVTSEEWSGLESNELSNIIRIRYDGSHYTFTDHELQGRRDFDRAAPPVVQNLDYSTITEGVYQLTWEASSAPDLWYYNVYYSVEGVPSAIPQRLIASVPRSRTSYIDWQARKDAPGYYRVTAVDRQGNESSSGAFFVSDLRVTRAVSGSGAVTVTLQWTPLPAAITTTLRYSPTRITEANWSGAASLTDTLPGVASTYTGTVSYTAGTVYFAIKSQNVEGIWSSVSNNAFWPCRVVFLPLVLRQ